MSAAAGSALLKAIGLQTRYGAIHAVKGIDFEVRQGEIVSLIGANGAGKTTTLRSISGLLPYSGSVTFCGKSLTGIAPHEIVKLGLSHSPEGRGVFPNLTVMENLEMGAYTRGHKKIFRKSPAEGKAAPDDKAAIREDYERCFELFSRLRERAKQKAGTLSGGEQQMLAMARALMSRPKLLMLDEPSLGLAPLIVAQVFEIIKQFNAAGMTILLVEQNARMALKASHRAYVMETGTIQFTGSGADLLGDRRVIDSYLGA